MTVIPAGVGVINDLMPILFGIGKKPGVPKLLTLGMPEICRVARVLRFTGF
jgi:hypothetical protein